MLISCQFCHRHVKGHAGLCPFCEAVLPASVMMVEATPGATRTVRMFATAAVLVACASEACGGSTTPSGGIDQGRDAAADAFVRGGLIYGSPPPPDAGTDTQGTVPPYGAPPPEDAGTD